jgi:hypothetical protein
MNSKRKKRETAMLPLCLLRAHRFQSAKKSTTKIHGKDYKVNEVKRENLFIKRKPEGRHRPQVFVPPIKSRYLLFRVDSLCQKALRLLKKSKHIFGLMSEHPQEGATEFVRKFTVVRM